MIIIARLASPLIYYCLLALSEEFADLLSLFCALRRQYPTVFSQIFHAYLFLHIINEFPLKHKIACIFPYLFKYF